jgi:PAS domain S-box-containing protein
LREAEEKHRTLLNSANVLVQSVDAEGKYLFVNEEWKKVLGYSEEDVTEITIMDVVRKDHLPYCMDVFRQVTSGLSIHNVETVFVTKDGRELTVSGNACPIFKDGKFVSTVAFFEDVTERKKNEERIKENNRRIELMNEKLRVVGSLTRHDVRNKLSVITGYSYILKKKHPDEVDVVDGLDKMVQAVKDSLKIFDFAKAYEQIGVEKLVYIDVEKATKEAAALFSGLPFKVVNECHGLTVRADSLLRQLVYNFIDNTRKYGQKTTVAKIHYKKLFSGDLELIYEDDGVGIPIEDKQQLFKQGFSTGGSTGFGLFLVKKMIEVYGWTVNEEGKPGEGAKFIIRIPRNDGENSFFTSKDSSSSESTMEFLSEDDLQSTKIPH